MNDWLLRAVRWRCLGRLCVSIVVVAVAAALVVHQRRYVQNFFGGPYPFDAAALNAIDDVSTTPRYFASVKGADAIDTGLSAVTIRSRGGVETSRSTDGSYYFLPVGDRFLLCKTSLGIRDSYQGVFAPIPARVAEAVFSTPEAEAMRARVYPYYLDDESFRVSGVVAIGMLLCVFFLVGRYALPAWKYFIRPSSHPLVTRAKGWPDPIATTAAAQQEAREFRHAGGAGWLVTDRFLIQSGFLSFDILRLADLLWAYKKVTEHRVNFIPMPRTYEIIFVCYGGTAVIPAEAAVAEEILAFVAERAPWAMFGYSDDLAAAFKTDPSAFAAAVEKRRRPPVGARRIRGQDVEETMELTFAEAAAGTRRSVRAGDGALLEVKVPAGVEFGSVLRLLGKGLPALSGGEAAGNLYLHVILRVTPDSRFTDRGSHDRN